MNEKNAVMNILVYLSLYNYLQSDALSLSYTPDLYTIIQYFLRISPGKQIAECPRYSWVSEVIGIQWLFY